MASQLTASPDTESEMSDVLAQWTAANVAARAAWSAGNLASRAVYDGERPPSSASDDALATTRTPAWRAHEARKDILERELIAALAANHLKWHAYDGV